MDFESIFGFKRFYKAIFYSFAGYKAALNSEQAFRQEVILLIFVIPLVIWMAKSPVESVLLLGSIILIMIVELLNTAIEFVVDRISSDHHELSGIAKDLGSAAVMLTIFLAIITWVLILI